MLHITDEFSALQSVVVCLGDQVPLADEYETDDPQETKWGWKSWDKSLLLDQQKEFFDRLSQYDVELIFLETEPGMDWQMYTRDTGFVVDDTLFYADTRTLKARHGEIEKLQEALTDRGTAMQAIESKIEGGDVLVHDGGCFIGISNRTTEAAVNEMRNYTDVRSFYLGDDIMHLDTRLTLLPDNYALVNLESFQEEDQKFLQNIFNTIPVTTQEAENLGTNVFVVNPETIFVEEKQVHIQDELRQAGFKVEVVPYSEPIALGGSFRCTTLPLVRKD